jgi:hypothetical protein
MGHRGRCSDDRVCCRLRRHGWALGDAVRRTHQLSGILKSKVGAPARTLPFASAAELGNSALYVVGFVWRYTNDLIARVKATAR